MRAVVRTDCWCVCVGSSASSSPEPSTNYLIFGFSDLTSFNSFFNSSPIFHFGAYTHFNSIFERLWSSSQSNFPTRYSNSQLICSFKVFH